MKRRLRGIYGFLIRDLKLFRAYKMAFFMHAANILFAVITYFFLSTLFRGTGVFESKGGYFNFVLPGIALSGMLMVVLNSFSSAISYEQSVGSLEILLQAPLSRVSLLLGLGAMAVLQQGAVFLGYFTAASFMGLSFSSTAWFSCIVVFIMSVAAFVSLGIVAASFIIVFKRGNPVTWAFTSLSVLLGGVYYPVESLPHFAQKIAYFMPLTFCLNLFRRTFNSGMSVFDLSGDIILLAVFDVIFIPLSVIVFGMAVDLCRRRGTLWHT